ncbi:MAG: CvpA family protein [Chloroflexota bacterium]
MNTVDIVILAAVLASAAVGFMQGFLRQTVVLLSLYLSAVLAAQYHLVVAGYLSRVVAFDPTLEASIGFALTFIWALLFLGWISRRAYPSMRILNLGVFDNLVGAALGALTGVIVVSVAIAAVLFAVSVDWPNYNGFREALDNDSTTSTLVPILSAYAPTFFRAVTIWIPGGVPAILVDFIG